MYVETIRLKPENLAMCAATWGGVESYAPGELQRVLDGAAQLLAQGRAQGAVILEDGEPRSFGITTFADEAFVDGYLDNPNTHLGKRLLLDALARDATSVLTVPQIAERNAGRGLQLVVANCNIDPQTRDPDTVMGAVIAATFDVHRGYRVVRYVNEVFGEIAVSMVAASGAFEIRRISELSVGHGTMRSLLGTVTREQAAARTSPMLALFAYSPPRLHFTPAEQRVLSEALGGAVDETLSARLGIPLSAVKARWTRIQERVVRYAPELVAAVRHGRGYGRGNQRRHLILNYVRDHPSELTPYAWPISRLPRFTAADYASRRRPRDLPAAVKPGSSGRVTRRR